MGGSASCYEAGETGAGVSGGKGLRRRRLGPWDRCRGKSDRSGARVEDPARLSLPVALAPRPPPRAGPASVKPRSLCYPAFAAPWADSAVHFERRIPGSRAPRNSL